MKHGKNFILGEYVIIKKPELVEVGDNVRIADFCRISSACKIGSDCEIAPGTYIAGGDGKYTFEMGSYSSLAAGVKIWLSSNDYVNELVTHSVPCVREPWTVYAGQPIRPIKKRNRANIMRTLMKIGCIEACEEAAGEERLCAE